MKVFNLTDVPTDVLRASSLVNVSISVGSVVVPPGGSVDVKKVSMSDLQRFFSVGALALNSLPEAYVQAKPQEPRNALVEAAEESKEETKKKK